MNTETHERQRTPGISNMAAHDGGSASPTIMARSLVDTAALEQLHQSLLVALCSAAPGSPTCYVTRRGR